MIHIKRQPVALLKLAQPVVIVSTHFLKNPVITGQFIYMNMVGAQCNYFISSLAGSKQKTKMKRLVPLSILIVSIVACEQKKQTPVVTKTPSELEGTWQLISARMITKKDTTYTDHTKGEKMIKIITPTHFSFFRHDLNKGKDSATAIFSAGGGTYTLKGDQYTESLEYFNAREWEGNDFSFTVTITGDTLVQTGLEKIEGTDINRTITEKYARVKN